VVEGLRKGSDSLVKKEDCLFMLQLDEGFWDDWY
jgi:hypothetical protein